MSMRLFIDNPVTEEKNVSPSSLKEKHVDDIAASERSDVDGNTIDKNNMTRTAQPDLFEIIDQILQKLSKDRPPQTKKAKRRNRKPAKE